MLDFRSAARAPLAGLAGLAILALAACGEPATFSEVLEQGVRQGLPGVVMQVRVGGQTWTGAAGVSDIAAGTAMRAGDRFLAVGATQPWIAAAVLQLVDEGAFGLDDGLTPIIGLEALYQVPDAQRMTVRQALNQTTGFHDHFELLGFLNDVVGPGVDPNRQREPAAPLAFFHLRGYRPIAGPGEQASFSGANATILGMVIEAADGMALNDALTARVFGPARVNAGIAAFGGPVPTVHNYVDLHDALVDVGPVPVPVEGRTLLYDLSAIDPSWAWASGGVSVTAAELAQLMDVLAAGGLAGPESTGMMMDPSAARQGPDDESASWYGLGLMHRAVPAGGPQYGDDAVTIAYGHDGEALGYAALVYTVPALDLTVSILANTSGQKVTLPQLFDQVVALVAAGGEGLFSG